AGEGGGLSGKVGADPCRPRRFPHRPVRRGTARQRLPPAGGRPERFGRIAGAAGRRRPAAVRGTVMRLAAAGIFRPTVLLALALMAVIGMMVLPVPPRSWTSAWRSASRWRS